MKINNRIAIDEILLSQDKTQALVSEVKRLALDVTAHKTKGDIISDDIKAMHDTIRHRASLMYDRRLAKRRRMVK